MELEIEKILVISTGHITLEDNTLLSEEDSYPYTSLQSGYGILVALTSDMQLPPKTNSIDFIKDSKEEYDKRLDNFSDAFIEILRIAKANNCFWINFDRDGSSYEELPTFDW